MEFTWAKDEKTGPHCLVTVSTIPLVTVSTIPLRVHNLICHCENCLLHVLCNRLLQKMPRHSD